MTPEFGLDGTGVGVPVDVGRLVAGVLRTGGFAVGVARASVSLMSGAVTTAEWAIAFLAAIGFGLT